MGELGRVRLRVQHVPERRPLPGCQHRRFGLGEEADGQSGKAAEGEAEVVGPRQACLHRLGQAGALARPPCEGHERAVPGGRAREGLTRPFQEPRRCRRQEYPLSPSRHVEYDSRHRLTLPGRGLQRPRQGIGALPGRSARAWGLLGVGKDDEEGLPPNARRFVGGSLARGELDELEAGAGIVESPRTAGYPVVVSDKGETGRALPDADDEVPRFAGLDDRIAQTSGGEEAGERDQPVSAGLHEALGVRGESQAAGLSPRPQA